MTIDRFQLQMMATQHEELLTSIFQTALTRVDADHGYLAFVDPNEHLRILVQKGEYWHLPADRGVSGSAFQTGKTIIDEPDSGLHGFRESGAATTVISEIAVPIFIGEVSVGILLFDSLRPQRKFSPDDAHYLEEQADRIRQVLSSRDPWSFRSWWAKERKKKADLMIAAAKKQLMGSLRDKFARFSDVEIRIAEVDEHGVAGRYEVLLETTAPSDGRDSEDAREPVVRAVALGRAQLIGEPVPRYRCYVPFPVVGPVVGVVKLETGVAELLNEETVDYVEHELRKLKIDALSVSVEDQVDGHFYLNFVQEALTAHLRLGGLSDCLLSISRQAGRLCGTEVIIYCVTDSLGILLGKGKIEPLKRLSRSDLLSHHLGVQRPNDRPNRFYDTPEGIICPIFDLVGELVGAISVGSTKDKLEDSFNTQVIEHASVLIGRTIENFRMRHSFDKDRTDGPSNLGAAFAPQQEIPTVRSQAESTEVMKWLTSTQSIDLEQYRVLGNYVVAEKKDRAELALKIDDIIKQVKGSKGPYPVLICAPPGSGKTFFVKEFAFKLIGATAKEEIGSSLIYGDLSSSQDISATLRGHFKKILIADAPRVAMLDEVDTKVMSDSAYRHLLRALEGGSVDLGDGAEAKLPEVLWFFAASSAEDDVSFRALLANEQKGADFFRRFEQSGAVLKLPRLTTPIDNICQTVANARIFQPGLKQVMASVLYYFAVSRWNDSGTLRAAVRTAVQDMEGNDILRIGAIANRSDFPSFLKIHADPVAQLENSLIRCN